MANDLFQPGTLFTRQLGTHRNLGPSSDKQGGAQVYQELADELAKVSALLGHILQNHKSLFRIALGESIDKGANRVPTSKPEHPACFLERDG